MFKIIKKCKTTNARVSELKLSQKILTPRFMPVGTYASMKSTPFNFIDTNLMLCNAYHCQNLPNLKSFMNIDKCLLTDSGGFQIGSLKFAKVTEQGVIFDGSNIFTPEKSICIQKKLGADIIMQLDEVINPNSEYEAVKSATERSLRWLYRCLNEFNEEEELKIKKVKIFNEKVEDPNFVTNLEEKSNFISEIEVNSNLNDEEHMKSNMNQNFREKKTTLYFKNNQILFPIIQGGLFNDLRLFSIEKILETNPIGIAIGGLSGGEEKLLMYRTIYYCTSNLPKSIPIYVMGIGYPEDILITFALGADLTDCVYPTRTARFGKLFCDSGDINISKVKNVNLQCNCFTCKNYTLEYLNLVKSTPNGCTLMSIHNLYYMNELGNRIREAILEDRFGDFVKEYLNSRYSNQIPDWMKEVLGWVNIEFN